MPFVSSANSISAPSQPKGYNQKITMQALTQPQIVASLQALGIEAGQILFLHSALSSLGLVAGGAATVVAALQEVLGPEGTLVAPAFTFAHGRAAEPIFDPRHDPSEMGSISETIRTYPGARRSCHLLHSVAAVGARAETITAVHGPSAWAADGPFWQLYEQDATIMLLGVPYLRCTWFHVIEQLVQVRYREWVEKVAWVRDDQGEVQPLPTLMYRSKADFAGNDFNKLGARLEEAGRVRVGAVGNAMARVFAVRDALALGVAHYRQDPLLFVKTGTDYHPLRDGVMTGEQYREKTVLDPTRSYNRR
jgi:aminoglycoside 3-N-acetyltransferase